MAIPRTLGLQKLIMIFKNKGILFRQQHAIFILRRQILGEFARTALLFIISRFPQWLRLTGLNFAFFIALLRKQISSRTVILGQPMRIPFLCKFFDGLKFDGDIGNHPLWVIPASGILSFTVPLCHMTPLSLIWSHLKNYCLNLAS